MCGFAGFIEHPSLWSDFDQGAISRMAAAVAHRGPDAQAVWTDPQAGVALGHRRLSILDLSENGAQPMASTDGRYVVAYNGEIYNHLELRDEMGGAAPVWHGHSDTETLLAGIALWGLEEFLKKAAGMFAFALWDRREKQLTLARDRFGEKPLYYGWIGERIAFGSEIKALRQCPGWQGKLDAQACALYRRFGFVPAPRSIHQDIYKLEAGCFVTLTPGQSVPTDLPQAGQQGVVRWWNSVTEATDAARDPITNAKVACEAVAEVLDHAVAQQRLSDVPLGAFLSGGIDSSLICAMLQSQGATPARTFTIRFAEAEYDESPHARAVATHLGTDHTELDVSAGDAMALVSDLAATWDEPFADSSQLPTWLVCRAAREQVVVALSGDGGDEMFGGYNRHVIGPKLHNVAARLPAGLRRAGAYGLQSVPPNMIDFAARLRGRDSTAMGQKIHKLARALSVADDPHAMYLSLLSDVPLGQEGPDPRTGGALPADMPTARKLMLEDTLLYLPDDIMVKVDRAAMACGLETRAPFLDHRVARVAWSIDIDLLIDNGRGKAVLRDLLDRYVPRALIDRPKAGFAIPLAAWLRGPLKSWASELLAECDVDIMPWSKAEIDHIWTHHQSGRADRGTELWRIIMLAIWLRDIARMPAGHTA